ncbi:MAG: hypothetical protein CEE43_13785 [Promethearchaeota archaeon Loki_b32]|nr:MAG: hypothetical protein CEE43_13785 [Candidatus Lokiarchaeota archaeon Loki_b32]
MSYLEVNETEIEVEEKGKVITKKVRKFWVLIDIEQLYLYADKTEAIKGLRERLPENGDATIAEIVYSDISGKGSFDVEGVSWKDIAMGWLPNDK